MYHANDWLKILIEHDVRFKLIAVWITSRVLLNAIDISDPIVDNAYTYLTREESNSEL